MFPSNSLNENENNLLVIELLKRSNRSLVLVPSEQHSKEIGSRIKKHTNLNIFEAKDIEDSKKDFINSDACVAIIANRYDGIDFPKEECRLLVIEGLPKAVNLQEQFLMTRMGANALFYERVQTRVIQAIGRCTRSLEDYSAVVVNGSELVDFLSNIKRRNYFHPELQAELEFGIEQSIDCSFNDFVENFSIFIENGESWEKVNNTIVESRNRKQKDKFSGLNELESCVECEIEYVKALWINDYEEAFRLAETVLGKITHSDLKGYRAMWNYLAGSAAFLDGKSRMNGLGNKARDHFTQAKRSAENISWLASLSRYGNEESKSGQADNILTMKQIDNIETLLSSIGVSNVRKLTQRERRIREGLESENGFEEAHRLLGEHIGFNAYNVETEASPDPWWQLDDLCFVFEDHANAENDTLNPNKARQVSSHPNWIKENVDFRNVDDAEIISVLLSPVTKMKSGCVPHLKNVSYFELSHFKNWAEEIFSLIQNIRISFSEPGDLVWREKAYEALVDAKLDVYSIKKMITDQKCSCLLKVVN